MLAWGYTPRSILSLGSTPFWHVAIWCAPDWLKTIAGWRLFQLVVVVARRKDCVRRQTDQRPRPARTWSAYVIDIPQGLVRWLLHTLPWWDMMSRPGRGWLPCHALMQPRRLHDLRTQTQIRSEDNYIRVILYAHPGARVWNAPTMKCTTTSKY